MGRRPYVKLGDVVTNVRRRRVQSGPVDLSDYLNLGRYESMVLLLTVLGALDPVYFVVCAYVFNETTHNMSLEAGADGEVEE
ncbi:unnamed protein product [Urochloa humidicola]